MISQLLDEMTVASGKQKGNEQDQLQTLKKNERCNQHRKIRKIRKQRNRCWFTKNQGQGRSLLRIKRRFRMAWKSPGFKNDEFTKIPTLKGKILNEWEILRINLAERSYKAPQGFKGFKIPSQYQEFQKPKTPPGVKKQLDEFRLDFEDFVQRPSKYGKVHEDEMLEKVRINNKEPFRLTNSVQHNEFGFDPHLTWEAEMNRKQSSSKNLINDNINNIQSTLFICITSELANQLNYVFCNVVLIFAYKNKYLKIGDLTQLFQLINQLIFMILIKHSVRCLLCITKSYLS